MECGMERRFHRGFTAAEKTELWDRWKRGESLKAIGRAFGKQSSSIYSRGQRRSLVWRGHPRGCRTAIARAHLHRHSPMLAGRATTHLTYPSREHVTS